MTALSQPGQPKQQWAEGLRDIGKRIRDARRGRISSLSRQALDPDRSCDAFASVCSFVLHCQYRPTHRGWPTTACRRRLRSGPPSKWRSSASSRSPRRRDLARGGFDLRVGRTGVAVRSPLRKVARQGDRPERAAPADLLAGLFVAVGVDLLPRGGNLRGAHRRMAHRRPRRAPTPMRRARGANGVAGGANAASANGRRGGLWTLTLWLGAPTSNAASASGNPAGALTLTFRARWRHGRTRPPRRTSSTAKRTCRIRRATPHSNWTTRWSSVFCRGSRLRWLSAFCRW